MSETESQFNRWFRSEVAAGFAVGAVVVSILLFFTGKTQPLETTQAVILQQLADLKNNDLTHIELQITEIKAIQAAQQQTQIEQGKELTQILTILKQK